MNNPRQMDRWWDAQPQLLWTLPRRPLRRATALAILGAAGLSAGCGSQFTEILFQAASAIGRSALDVALTDLANDLVSAAEDQAGDDGEPAADDGADGAEMDGGETDSGDGGDVTGDAAAGEVVFADGGCASCHCQDASGGCALDAPSLVGATAATIETFLTSGASHPVQADLTAQELADLEAYLASLGG